MRKFVQFTSQIKIIRIHYCPISLLSSVSKWIETNMLKKMKSVKMRWTLNVQIILLIIIKFSAH